MMQKKLAYCGSCIWCHIQIKLLPYDTLTTQLTACPDEIICNKYKGALSGARSDKTLKKQTIMMWPLNAMHQHRYCPGHYSLSTTHVAELADYLRLACGIQHCGTVYLQTFRTKRKCWAPATAFYFLSSLLTELQRQRLPCIDR